MTRNWSYFKPEFSDKPEEEPKEHILRTIAWMDAHNIAAGQRVQRFPLTIAGPYILFNVNGKNYRRDLGLRFLR